ncbi:hypothetical protein D9M70_629370 [compost metagenome]
MHQVKALEFDVLNARQLDCAGVVDQRINAAEMFVGLGQCFTHRDFITHIHLQGQRLAACVLDFLRHTENRTRQFGMRLGTFGRNHNVGPVARGAQCDLTTNPATGAGNEQGFAL